MAATEDKTEDKKDSFVKGLFKNQLVWTVVAILALVVVNRIADPGFLTLSWNDSTVSPVRLSPLSQSLLATS